MSTIFLPPPADFDSVAYKYLNPDLPKYGDLECRIHYTIYGKEAKRRYKFSQDANLPNNFCVKKYKRYNPDLSEMNDAEATIHFLVHGKLENRLYSVELPEGFDAETYCALNKDLAGLPGGWLEVHYAQHGKRENRKYTDSFFDEAYFIAENNVLNYKGYTDYLQDIRKMKSRLVADLIEGVPSHAGCVLLLNHETSYYGASNYLYTVFNKLKKEGLPVILLDVYQNERLLSKFQISVGDVYFYQKDATILYWLCKKIAPKVIYINSINSEIQEVIKYLPASSYFLHSHEIKEHYIDAWVPDFVVSKKISEQYGSVPKIQPPIFTQEMLRTISTEFNTFIPVGNTHGLLDGSKITIGMCGSLTSRKNYKLFIAVARQLVNFNFLWIGGTEAIENAAIPNLYHVQDTTHPCNYYNQIDYFVLFSKQDPCPYVVLENLFVGNKVVTFRDNIYTDHKCELLKDTYFEYPGEISFESACSYIQEVCKNKAERSENNGKEYIEKNYTSLTTDMLSRLV